MWEEIFAVDSLFSGRYKGRMAGNPLYLKRRWQLLSRRPNRRNDSVRKRYISLRVALLKRQFRLPSEVLSLRNLSLSEEENENPISAGSSSFSGVHRIFEASGRGPVTRISFGKTLKTALAASAVNGSLSLLRNLDQRSPLFLESSPPIYSFDLSESDEFLVVAEESSVLLRDTVSGKTLRNTSDISALAVRFLPRNNNFVVCLLRSGEVAIMNVSTGKFASSSLVPGKPSCLALLDLVLWVGNDQGVVESFKLNPNSGKIQKGCRIHTQGPIKGMDASSLNGRSLLLVHQGSDYPGREFLCYRIVDDSGTIVPYKSFDSDTRIKTTSFTFAPVSGLVAAGAEDGSLSLYNMEREGKAIVNKLHGHLEPVISVAFSCDEAFMATGDTSGQIIVWKK